ncbi:hypothetical protein F0562_029615 [Nyssa sinensis]|uniref:DNA-3-methyladenine glycosylase I n=1 Tax=Nyssa sinensis TaxID=561372 RepID=A0A5J5B3A2_9ASTE|nr:hypothetical protein F0562_029615 [Nyssa sinensis]
MCSSKSKLQGNSSHADITGPTISHINGRPVLQPTCNRVPLLERRNSLKKTSPKSSTPSPLQPLSSPTNAATIFANPTPISPKLKSPRPPAVKRAGTDPNGLNSSVDKVLTPRSTTKSKSITTSVKKSKKCGGDRRVVAPSQDASALKYSSSLIVEAPGSIAAARREHVAIMQVQRKMRIAHYGRTKSAKYEGKVVAVDSSPAINAVVREEKRCSFITANSDPIYVAYHDEEWGVPVHDDKLLFELLVLTGAQVGSDWTFSLKEPPRF